MKLEGMTKEERSLLLFLESCAVEKGGLVDSTRLNEEDNLLIKKWMEIGFVNSGRVQIASVRKITKPSTQWVELSDEAWQRAHEERKARSMRLAKARRWKKTCER